LAIWKKNNKKDGKYNPPDSKLFKEIEKDRGTIPSIISEGSEFKGNIKTSGEIQIDGVLNGNIRAKQIVVGVNGNVRGNVTANFLRICGKIEGEIRAETLEIVSSASVKGNVFKKTISIESGSKVIGNINELESTTAKIFKLQRKSLDKEEN
jgi:cytoskeletal protein CcmA (bactofilin family)